VEPNRRHPSSAAAVAGAERTDDALFAALLAADGDWLEATLANDFVIIDVVGGSVIERGDFIAAIAGGVVRFRAIDLIERMTRRYGDTAVIVGRTRMAGSVEGVEFEAASRYTHVFARGAGGVWRVVNAQGTRIVDPPAVSEAA
jgi:ketosteroid isomerase-like protein